MLALPENWRSYNAEHLTRGLLAQIPPGVLRDEFARHLMRTHLEMATARGGGKPVRIVDLGSYAWRVNDYTFTYLPAADDAALARAIALGRESPHTYLIVPPGHRELLRRAVEPILKGRTPEIQALDEYTSLRVLFTSLDRRCGTREVFLDVLRRYNQRVIDAKADDSVLVDIPRQTA